MVNIPLCKNNTYKRRDPSSIFMRKETIVFPCDDMGSMILWEVSFEYVHFNEQSYIKNRKVYE
jgi:hypothetical protein